MVLVGELTKEGSEEKPAKYRLETGRAGSDQVCKKDALLINFAKELRSYFELYC